MDWWTVVKIVGAGGGWAVAVALAGLVWGFKARLDSMRRDRDLNRAALEKAGADLEAAHKSLAASELAYRRAAQEAAVRHAEEMATVSESETVLKEVLKRHVTPAVAADALDECNRLLQERRNRKDG